MKTKFLQRVVWMVIPLLTMFSTRAGATDFTLSSASDVTKDGITVSFGIGTGTNNPAWYAAGLRLYASNTVTISVSTGNITGITFNWEKQGSKTFASATASTGTYTHPAAAGEGTWSGSAASITFTLGSSGQLQLNTLSVTAGASKTDRTLSLSYSSTSLQVCGGNSSNPTKSGNTTEPGTESWSSSNTSVATVSNTGVVTPVGAGSATITWSVAATTNYNAGSTTASFTVSAASARTVTWHVEGGSSTTSVTPGSQATPPTPDPTPSCGGTFVGWVATGDAVIGKTPTTGGTSAPSTIYTSSNKPTITCDGNVDFYAVFKKPMDD